MRLLGLNLQFFSRNEGEIRNPKIIECENKNKGMICQKIIYYIDYGQDIVKLYNSKYNLLKSEIDCPHDGIRRFVQYII